jgi:hypothetical protein
MPAGVPCWNAGIIPKYEMEVKLNDGGHGGQARRAKRAKRRTSPVKTQNVRRFDEDQQCRHEAVGEMQKAS